LDLAESAKRRKCGGLLGDVVVIDGRPSIDDVTAEIVSDFEPRYRGWVENVRDYEDSSGEQLALELWGPDNSKANSGPVRES
jgi:hypothetical protein